MEKIAKFSKRTKFKEFKKKQIDLTQEERKIVKARKAEWSDGQSAIWKAQDNDGDTMYLTHTYRAFSAAPTLKGAISKFHNFIRSTASEYKDMEIEKISRESMNLVNATFEKIAAMSKKRNVTLRAANAGALGALGGLALAEKTNKFPKKPAMLIGAGALAGASIAKNVMHNRKLEEKTAFDIVNEVFEKKAGIGVGSDNNLYYYRDHYDSEDKYDNIYDKAREMDIANGQEGYEDNGNAWNAVDNEIYRYINEHPNKQKALDDLEFNIRRNSAKHKHSGKVIKAGALLGAVAPTALAAGTGLALGAINPKLLSTKPQGNIVFPTLSRGAAALKGAKKGALASLYGAQLLGGIPQIAGITAGLGIGNRVAKKMNKKVKDSMGPARLDNFNTIENDLDNHILNPNTQKNIFDNVKYEK